jgi:hypothetical protein
VIPLLRCDQTIGFIQMGCPLSETFETFETQGCRKTSQHFTTSVLILLPQKTSLDCTKCSIQKPTIDSYSSRCWDFGSIMFEVIQHIVHVVNRALPNRVLWQLLGRVICELGRPWSAMHPQNRNQVGTTLVCDSILFVDSRR